MYREAQKVQYPHEISLASLSAPPSVHKKSKAHTDVFPKVFLFSQKFSLFSQFVTHNYTHTAVSKIFLGTLIPSISKKQGHYFQVPSVSSLKQSINRSRSQQNALKFKNKDTIFKFPLSVLSSSPSIDRVANKMLWNSKTRTLFSSSLCQFSQAVHQSIA